MGGLLLYLGTQEEVAAEVEPDEAARRWRLTA